MADQHGNGLRCCIVTPIGPGHEKHYTACRNSVLAAFQADPGPFKDIVFAAMDDRQGLHGRSQRRNDGIQLAIEQSADWIFFLDADDIMTGSAFACLNKFYKANDAVWGAILETRPGERPHLRPNQVIPVISLYDVLDHDPMLTLQMGHFVRTQVAQDIRFDTRMDAGEDFKYYLQLWRDYRCIKQDIPLFLNRRGMHSSGPRAADGESWTESVANEFVNFGISNHRLIKRHYEEDSAGKPGRHVLICGFPQSGETLFYNMLRNTVSNFDFMEPGEPAARHISEHPGNLITCRNLDIFDIHNIMAANKQGQPVDFILLLKDVRSILTASRGPAPDDYFISYDFQRESPSEKTPGLLAAYQAVITLLRGETPGKKIIVRYEDLIPDTVKTQAYLGRSLQLCYRGRFENFRIPAEAADSTVEMENRHATQWKQPVHRERIRSQFMQCPALFGILIQTGYEKDNAWFTTYQ